MELTEKLKARIRLHEGVRSVAYRDTLGNVTVGIGHLVQTHEQSKYVTGLAISNSEIELLFAVDVFRAAVAAEELIGDIILPVDIQEVIVEMVFQLGKTGVSKFKRMWEALADHNYLEAAYQMRDSRWYNQTPSRCDNLAHIVECIKIK